MEFVNWDRVKLTANILFSGIGCQERGIENSKLFALEVKCTSDINKEAILSYAAIHHGLTNQKVKEYDKYPSDEEMAKELLQKRIGYNPETGAQYDWNKCLTKGQEGKFELEKYWLAVKLANNLGDISEIKKLDYADLWTISFPCQSISIAGKMKGFKPDSGTRSSLLWQNIRLLKTAKDHDELPKYLIFENVKNLVQNTFKKNFMELLDVLNDLGYNSYWKVLNATECGRPQNRERCFVVCVRKDIDTEQFDFPIPFDNGIRLNDLFDSDVDEKFYIDETRVQDLVQRIKKLGVLPLKEEKLENKLKFLCGYPSKENWNKLDVLQLHNFGQGNRVYDCRGASVTLSLGGGLGGKTGIYLVKENYNGEEKYRIRKLTPCEAFALMGMGKNDAIACQNIGVKDTQILNQAGNGIVTNCIELIMEHLYKAQYDNKFITMDEIQNNE